MATFTKAKLSGSAADGRGVKITTTDSSGAGDAGLSDANTIHTAVSGTTAGTFDEIWLWATNVSASAAVLSIELGAGADLIHVTVPPKEGLMQILPGLVLQNSLVVKGYASAEDVIWVHGFVNKIA